LKWLVACSAPVGCQTPGAIAVVEEAGVAERVRVRDITNDEGNRLLRIVPRSSGSVVTWRRAQMVLLSAAGHGRAGPCQGDLHQPRPGP
jgi:hypothetical protein